MTDKKEGGSHFLKRILFILIATFGLNIAATVSVGATESISSGHNVVKFHEYQNGGLLLAAKSSKGKLGKKARRKVTKTTLKNSKRKKKYKSSRASKKTPRKIRRKKTGKRNSTKKFGFVLPLPTSKLIPILMMVFFAGLIIYHRRLEALDAVPQRFMKSNQKQNVNFEAKEVFLDKNRGIDPNANKTAGLQLSFGETAIEEINLDNDTNADCAVDLDQAVSIHGSQIELNFGKDVPFQRLSQPNNEPAVDLNLPGDMSMHFKGMPLESKLWQGLWDIPLVSKGSIVITNKRILSTYTRTSFAITPPFVEYQFRRHQTKISNIRSAEHAAVRRPSFLVAGMILSAWFPTGNIAAIFCFVGYLFLNRKEFGVALRNNHYRTYPLNSSDLISALEVVGRIKQKQTEQTSKAQLEAS
jgi:hypothetical protein